MIEKLPERLILVPSVFNDAVLREKINELIDEIEELKIQLSRVKKDRPDPARRSPYDLNRPKSRIK